MTPSSTTSGTTDPTNGSTTNPDGTTSGDTADDTGSSGEGPGTTVGSTGSTGDEGSSESSTGGGEAIACFPAMAFNAFVSGCAEAPEPSFSGSLPCSGEIGSIDGFDIFVVDATAGDCLSISSDNGEVGAADLVAIVWEPASGNIYGLEEDFSELDDEVACSVEPWSGFGCAANSMTLADTGQVFVAIAQWGGGCEPMADYSIGISLNGTPVDLSGGPDLDDHILMACG